MAGLLYFTSLLISRSSSPTLDVSQEQPDLEVGTTVDSRRPEIVAASSPSNANISLDAESRRVVKLMNPVAIAIAAADIVLYVNLPDIVNVTVKLQIVYEVHIATIWVCFFVSLGICTLTIIFPSGAVSVLARKRLMLVAIGCIVLSFVLHAFLVLSSKTFGLVALFFLLVVGLAFVCLFVVRKKENYGQTAADPENTANVKEIMLIVQ